jgi:hypothetical protein
MARDVVYAFDAFSQSINNHRRITRILGVDRRNINREVDAF